MFLEVWARNDLTILLPLFECGTSFKFCYRYYNDGETKNIAARAFRWKAACAFILIFQLAPVLRHWQQLQIAKKCRKAEKEGDSERLKEYFNIYLKDDSDLVLLRIIECFLEAAPQQTLQITILLLDYDHLSRNLECKY